MKLVVDGLEPKPGITLWGVATPTSEGLYRCYANVYGELCVVELTVSQINGDEELPTDRVAHGWNKDAIPTEPVKAERPEVTYALRPLDEMIRTGRPKSDRAPKCDVPYWRIEIYKQVREELAAHLAECIILPGWRCKSPWCSAWMGAEKQELTHCRRCNAPRNLAELK